MTKPNDNQAEGEYYNKLYSAIRTEQQRETGRSINKQAAALQSHPAERTQYEQQDQLVTIYSRTIDQLQQQRDDLLAALRDIASGNHWIGKQQQIAKAAIAAAEGTNQ